MNRKQTFWCPSPDDDGPEREWLKCRLAGGWYATDGDRAILPVTKLRRRGESSVGEVSGLLVQFGGADLILDLGEAGIEEGDDFVVVNPHDGRPYIDEAAEIPDDTNDT